MHAIKKYQKRRRQKLDGIQVRDYIDWIQTGNFPLMGE
jgi:hypothetical protein